MKNLVLTAVLIMATVSSSDAQTDKTKCEVLEGPMNSTGEAARQFFTTFSSIQFTGMASQFQDQNVRMAMDHLAEAHSKFVGPLKEFTDALEDAAYALKKCGR